MDFWPFLFSSDVPHVLPNSSQESKGNINKFMDASTLQLLDPNNMYVLANSSLADITAMKSKQDLSIWEVFGSPLPKTALIIIIIIFLMKQLSLTLTSLFKKQYLAWW